MSDLGVNGISNRFADNQKSSPRKFARNFERPEAIKCAKGVLWRRDFVY
jgi:hypothetical protein